MRVRIEQYLEYGEGGETAIRLSEWRVFPMPMPDKTVTLCVGEAEMCLTREGAIELASELRKAALDG
jgi:hypothetical protein